MPNKTLALSSFLIAMAVSPEAYALSCGVYTNQLTNGTTADAAQVMVDFEQIRTCANTAAPLASPFFTTNIGIGAAASSSFPLLIYSATATILAEAQTNNNAAVVMWRGENDSTGNAADTLIQLNNNAANTYLHLWGSGFTSSGSHLANGTELVGAGAGGLTLTAADASGVMRFFTGGSSAERARLSATGLFGIGTTTPATPLNIFTTRQGAPSLTSAANASVEFGSNITTALDIGHDSAAPYAVWLQIARVAHDGTSWPFAINPLGGNVGIGTASPATALHVVGTIRQTNCTTAGTLSANTSGDIICTSDARLKNIVGDYTSGLDALSRITPKLFTYKTTPSDPVETFVHAGFIAQNVMAVIPQASARQRDGYYSLDTTAILAAAVNSIKQLDAAKGRQVSEIVDLKRRLDQSARDLTAARADIRAQSAAIQELRLQIAALRPAAKLRTAAR